jgi:hypothetical protein
VVDDADVAVLVGQGVGDLGGPVGRLVVDDDQLVVADHAVGDHRRADRRRRGDRPFDVVLLVPHGEEDRQQLGGCRRHRSWSGYRFPSAAAVATASHDSAHKALQRRENCTLVSTERVSCGDGVGCLRSVGWIR